MENHRVAGIKMKRCIRNRLPSRAGIRQARAERYHVAMFSPADLLAIEFIYIITGSWSISID